MSSNSYETQKLFQFREMGLEPTGKKEVSGFRDIDRALGNHIAVALQNIVVSTETRHNKALARFAERPPQDQVLIGHFEDLRDMVRSIRQARAGRVSAQNNKFANLDALPLVNLTRTLDVSYGYTDRQLDRQDYAQLVDANGNVQFMVAALPVTLTYNLTIVSADKEPLAMLCNLLAGHFYWMHSTALKAQTSMCGTTLDIECAFNNLKGMMISDVSLPVGEDRLFGGQMSLELLADTLTAFEVKASPRNYQVGVRVNDRDGEFAHAHAMPGKNIGGR